jgi:hypothetical protein
MSSRFFTLTVVFCLFIYQNIQAQGIYGVAQKSNTGENYLMSVDATSGSVTILSATPLGLGLSQGIYSIDQQNKRFFFLAPVDSLYTIDLQTGNYLYKVKNSLSDSFQHVLYAYHCVNEKLYSLAQNNTTGFTYLTTVNPTTGENTMISVNPISQGLAQGVYAIDPGFNRLILLSQADTIITVDLLTGNVISKYQNSLYPQYITLALEYNSQNGALYALMLNVNQNSYYLATIDVFTGATQLISNAGSATPFAQALTTIDAITGSMFVVTAGDSIHKIDLATGNYSWRVVNNLGDSFINTAIEANNSCLTSIKTTGIANASQVNNVAFEVYPNPIQSVLKLTLSKVLNSGQITLSNNLGNIVCDWQNQQGTNVELSLPELSSGVYFLVIKEKGQLIGTKKVVKF